MLFDGWSYTMGLFGLLGYIEPVLLLVVSIGLLGESLTRQKIATYGPIWLAVSLIALHTALQIRRSLRGGSRCLTLKG